MSFTGLEITEFDIISKEIESKYYEHEIKRLSNMKRKRDVGAGRPLQEASFIIMFIAHHHGFKLNIIKHFLSSFIENFMKKGIIQLGKNQ